MLKSGSRVLNYALKKCKNKSGGADLHNKEISRLSRPESRGIRGEPVSLDMVAVSRERVGHFIKSFKMRRLESFCL